MKSFIWSFCIFALLVGCFLHFIFLPMWILAVAMASGGPQEGAMAGSLLAGFLGFLWMVVANVLCICYSVYFLKREKWLPAISLSLMPICVSPHVLIWAFGGGALPPFHT